MRFHEFAPLPQKNIIAGLEKLGYKLVFVPKDYRYEFVLKKGSEYLWVGSYNTTYRKYHTTYNTHEVVLGIAAQAADGNWSMLFGRTLPRTFTAEKLKAYLPKLRKLGSDHAATAKATVKMLRSRMRSIGAHEEAPAPAHVRDYYGWCRWVWTVPTPTEPGAPKMLAFAYVDLQGRLIRMKISVRYGGKVLFNRFEHIKTPEKAEEILSQSWSMFVRAIQEPAEMQTAVAATDPEVIRKMFRRYKNRSTGRRQ